MYRDTHIYISKIALDEAKGSNIKLNERLFLIGSTIPDYSPFHKAIRHYLNESLDYLKRLIMNIIGFNNINKISFYLGVIAHYISDYFCSPHYNNMSFLSKDVLTHIEYERGLNKFIEGKLIMDNRRYRFDTLEDLVVRKLNDYNNKNSYIEDLETAINAVINMIINTKEWGMCI